MSPRSILLVAVPQARFLDLVGPMEVFNTANDLLVHRGKAPAYTLELAGFGAHVTTAAGVRVVTTPVARCAPPHTLMIGGKLALGVADPLTSRQLEALRPLAVGAKRVTSVCAGAFVLGQLGLLAGRRCTTHWMVAHELQRLYPDAIVAEDALYVDEDPVYTAAGMTAGVDLALYLLERDHGPALALAVARLMVVFLHRPGGQSQFSAALTLRANADDRLRSLVARVLEAPAEDHSVEAMAATVGMSARHFARVFQKQLGKPPATFVREARLDAARRALEVSDHGLAQVAADTGFGTEETLRRVFHQSLGTTPAAYRQRFHRGSAAR